MRRTAHLLIISFALCTGVVLIIFSGLLALGILRPAAALGADDDNNVAFQPHPGARFPLGTGLVDETGSGVALQDYFTKTPVILVLEYFRCTSLCGVTLRSITDALARLPLEPGRDYQLVAISIDLRESTRRRRRCPGAICRAAQSPSRPKRCALSDHVDCRRARDRRHCWIPLSV